MYSPPLNTSPVISIYHSRSLRKLSYFKMLILSTYFIRDRSIRQYNKYGHPLFSDVFIAIILLINIYLLSITLFILPMSYST